MCSTFIYDLAIVVFFHVMGFRDMQTHNTCISEFRVYFTLCCLSLSDTLLSVLWRISANYKTVYIHHAQYCNNCNGIDYIRCITSSFCIQNIKTIKQLIIVYRVRWAVTLNVAILNNEFIFKNFCFRWFMRDIKVANLPKKTLGASGYFSEMV